MKQRCYLLVCFIACVAQLSAQFSHQATIKGVQQSGLYKMSLDPLARQYMSSDLHDVRIYDGAQKEVPYVLLSEPLLKSKTDFVPYPILTQKHLENHSEIVIHNINKDGINNIAFNINNSDAHKYCAIEGSDDLDQWYSLSAVQELSLVYNNVYTNTYKCIYFPLSDYRYFRLTIEDWRTEPLKINSAGYFKNSVIAGQLAPVVFAKTQKENAAQKVTTIHLSSVNSQKIDRIDFKISSPRLFMRHARVYEIREQRSKHKTEQYKETLCEFDLSAGKPLFFDVPQLTGKDFFIDIENKDNPPLEIDSVICKQLATYLVCDLNADNKYTLKCGNMALKIPEYDLVNFVSATPQLLPAAEVEDFKQVTPAKEKSIAVDEVKPKSKAFYETRPFIWVCLGFAAIIIFWFSRNLLRDMNKEE